MATQVATIGVGKLTSTDLYVDKFLVEIYSDAGFTVKVGQATAAAVWTGSLWEQKQAVLFGGLIFGTTYFLRSTTVAPISGTLGAWSTFSLTAGTATGPNPTYTLTSQTPQLSGITYVVTVSSIPTDIEHFEWTYTTDNSIPFSTTKPRGTMPLNAANQLSIFAGALSSQTVRLFIRAVNTSQQVQAWTEPGTATTPLANILDNLLDTVTYVKLANAPTNRNLIPDSGFKTWNSNALYWVPSSFVLLPGMGADGGNAIGYLGTGAPSGFPEAGLRKNPILLSPGNYTLSAYMDATFVTTSALDMGLYLSIGTSGAPTALDGGLIHNIQNPGVKSRAFVNFTLAIRTRTNGMSVAINDLILDTNGNLQACTVAGTAAGSPPTWATTLAAHTTDGTAQWTLINLAANMLGGTQVPFNLLMFPSNATVTSGKYAIISNPQLEVTPPSNTPTPYKENAGDDTTGTMLVDLSNTKHGSMSVSTLLNPQGSIVPGQTFTISYTFTDTSISPSWSSASLLRADGSSLSVASGSTSFTGLTASTKYYLYPYINVQTGTVGFANSSPPPSGTSGSASQAAQAAFDGRQPLVPIVVTTAATGGSGSGSGGDGTTCPEENELVDVLGKGVIRAELVEWGDYIKGFSFKSSGDVYRKVIGKSYKTCSAWRRVDGHLVTPCEPIFYNGQWMPAFRVPGSTFEALVSYRMDISVETDDFAEHNFWLVGGDKPLIIHNPVLPRS